MGAILDGIMAGIAQTGYLEWIAVLTGLLSVWFSMKENILVYPFGIISVLIYVYLAFEYKLYADMGVNSYYFVMSVYGWVHWKSTDDETRDQIPVSVNSKKENGYGFLLWTFSLIILYLVLRFLTDSDVPFWDALTTSFAILGMWLMARKKLGNWLAWIITDTISVPLYFYKGLVLTSFQFLIFTGLAVAGYLAWKKSYRNEIKSGLTKNTA